jgi:hypothetical protein
MSLDNGDISFRLSLIHSAKLRLMTAGQLSSAFAVEVYSPTTVNRFFSPRVNARTITQGDAITFTTILKRLWTDGKWRALAAKTVALQGDGTGSWRTLLRRKTTSTGKVALTITPRSTQNFRLVFGGVASAPISVRVVAPPSSGGGGGPRPAPCALSLGSVTNTSVTVSNNTGCNHVYAIAADVYHCLMLVVCSWIPDGTYYGRLRQFNAGNYPQTITLDQLLQENGHYSSNEIWGNVRIYYDSFTNSS